MDESTESSSPPPSKEPLSKEAKWERFATSLSPAAQAALQGKVKADLEDEGRSEFRLYSASLSPAARDAIKTASDVEPEWPAGRKPQYLLIEQEDGEFSTVKIFKNDLDMAQRVVHLDNTDTVVWAVYGILMPISKPMGEGVHRHRFIFKPDDTAIKAGAVPVRVDALDAEVSVQDDGFLGPPEFLVVASRPQPAVRAPARRQGRRPPRGGGSEEPFEGEGDAPTNR